MTTALANTDVVCSDIELLAFDPPSGTCGEYLQSYIAASGGYLVDPSATTNCSFCSISSTNTFLAGVSNSYSNRWRDFGLLWAFVICERVSTLLSSPLYADFQLQSQRFRGTFPILACPCAQKAKDRQRNKARGKALRGCRHPEVLRRLTCLFAVNVDHISIPSSVQ